MKHIFLFIAVVILFNCKPEKEEPKPLTAPVLTTMEAGDITAISALSGGAISSDGGSPVTARGIVWSVSHNPTLSDSVSEEGTGIGSFTSDLTPLKYSTTYYVRAYATNSIGTTYGNEVTFNTKSAIPSDGLVGWWPFNGNANDESGNGNDGVAQNGASLTSDRFYQKNAAYNFDFINNNLIRVPHRNNLNLMEDFTISIWVNSNDAPSTANNYTMVSKHDNYGSCCGNNIPYACVITWNAGGHYQKPSLVYAENGNFTFPESDTLITVGSWQHFIFINKSDTVKMFLDGKQISNSFYSSSLRAANSEDLLFGATNRGPSLECMNGKLDDIAIYNRALTAEEIQKIYNGTGF